MGSSQNLTACTFLPLRQASADISQVRNASRAVKAELMAEGPRDLSRVYHVGHVELGLWFKRLSGWTERLRGPLGAVLLEAVEANRSRMPMCMPTEQTELMCMAFARAEFGRLLHSQQSLLQAGCPLRGLSCRCFPIVETKKH